MKTHRSSDRGAVGQDPSHLLPEGIRRRGPTSELVVRDRSTSRPAWPRPTGLAAGSTRHEAQDQGIGRARQAQDQEGRPPAVIARASRPASDRAPGRARGRRSSGGCPAPASGSAGRDSRPGTTSTPGSRTTRPALRRPGRRGAGRTTATAPSPRRSGSRTPAPRGSGSAGTPDRPRSRRTARSSA